MRLRNIIAALFLCSSALLAQNCTNTPDTGAPLNLSQPDAHCKQWNVQLNQNFGIINTFASSTIKANPTASQSIAQPAFTYLNINSLLVLGTMPYVAFGQSANIPSGFLSESAGGNFSLDTTIMGNRGANLALRAVDTTSGYTISGTAPTGTILCASGGFYVPCSSLPAGLVSGYQTIQSNTSPLPQRANLNFGSSFSVTDNAGSNRTDVNLTSTGAAGSYTYASITVGTDGRVTGASSGAPPGGTNYYWTQTGCVIGVGQPNSCNFNAQLPGNMPDANYQVFCTLNFKSDTPAAACNVAQASLPTSSGSTIQMRIGQYQQNGTTGATVPDVYLHAHHD